MISGITPESERTFGRLLPRHCRGIQVDGTGGRDQEKGKEVFRQGGIGLSEG